MLVTALKPEAELLDSLSGSATVFLLGCGGCASASGTGGAEHLPALRALLEGAGKAVAGGLALDYLCDRWLVRSRLSPLADEIARSDCLLVATCGIGVQCVAESVSARVRPACNTVNLGGVRGTWPGSERCAECGDCLLDRTGGICPMTTCPKGMVNGPCGGTTRDGKCEVDRLRDCGWHRIYLRLKELGELDRLREIVPPKRHGLFLPDHKTMAGPHWTADPQPEGGDE